MLKYSLIALGIALLAVVVLAGLRGTLRPDRPLQIFPDMRHQPKVLPQHPGEFFADGRAARPPVAGTVPLGYALPGAYRQPGAGNAEDRAAADGSPAAALAADGAAAAAGFGEGRTDYLHTGRSGDVYGDGIPLAVTPRLIDRGRERFGIFCAPCHGPAGYGDGVITKLGMVGPANYHQDRLRQMPDGQIFNTITRGKNTMGAYGGNIAVADRWAIIAYLRVLQRSQNARPADAPAAARAFLEAQPAATPAPPAAPPLAAPPPPAAAGTASPATTGGPAR